MNKISKIIWSVFSGVLCMVYGDVARAAHNCTEVSPVGRPESSNINTLSDLCIDRETKCYYVDHISATYCFQTCKECRGGTTPKYKKHIGVLSSDNCASGNIYAADCECDCGDGCPGVGSWVAHNTGYQKNTRKTCNCEAGTGFLAVCEEEIIYRCAVGYYGSSTNGTSGCSKCPWLGTSGAGALNVSSCYIPKGNYSDLTGKFAYDCDCPYGGKDSCSSSSV